MEETNNKLNLTDEQISRTINQIEAVGKELKEVKRINKGYCQDKKEFTEHLVNAFNESYKGDDYERMLKQIKGLYNLIVKARTNTDDTKGGCYIPGYVRKITETFVFLFYAFQYLGYKDIDNILKDFGIEINAKKIEQVVKYLDNPGLQETLKMFVNNGVDGKKETDKIKDKIENDIYTKIPSELQNDYGISKGTFKKLYMLNFIKNINTDNASKKYEGIREEVNKHTQSDTVTTLIADNVMEEIIKNS